MLTGIALNRKSHGVFIVSFILAGVLLFFALRGVHWSEVWRAIRHGRADYLALSLVTISIMYLLYGLRWRVLLQAEHPIGILPVFYATMIGYIGNNLLPARAGDIIRPVVIGRTTVISTSYALATTVTERILDTAALVLFSLVASTSLAGAPGWLHSASQVMAALALVGIIALFVAPRMEHRLNRALHRLTLPEVLSLRVATVLEKFLLGMRAFQRPRNALGFSVLTVAIWLVGVLTTMEIAWALHLSLSWQQALLLLVALGLASAVPSTPGYVGIFQFVAVTVMVPFGLSRDQALAYIFVFQVVTYTAVILWGTVGIWRTTEGRYRMTQSRRLDEAEEKRSVGTYIQQPHDILQPVRCSAIVRKVETIGEGEERNAGK